MGGYGVMKRKIKADNIMKKRERVKWPKTVLKERGKN